MKKREKRILIFLFIIFILVCVLYYVGIIPHKKYTNEDFSIPTYHSFIDKDLDGVDDQTDILNNVRDYIAKKPKYKSKYYGTGYPDDEYGTCVDVVGFGLLYAGYDIKELLNEDVLEYRDLYSIDVVDKNIDFRRVQNLNVYFKNHAISLTTNLKEIESWQGGDIVVFDGHIGIVSDKRNRKGIPFLIHHANPNQLYYEEDVMERYHIIGHYRIS